MRLTPIPARRSTPPGGFSLLELMIGITVGLFILLGASSLMVSQIGDHRRLALETRTEQRRWPIPMARSRSLTEAPPSCIAPVLATLASSAMDSRCDGSIWVTGSR